MDNENRQYRVLDLFAGAGGLSLGFVQTGRFRISVAVENNGDAQRTYHRNHPDVLIFGDICDLKDYKKFACEYGPFDVIIGGPPCQGFSSANRQRNQLVSHNNSLVKRYIRVIMELQPLAFLMENVSLLRSEVNRFYCARPDCMEIEQLGIATREETLSMFKGRLRFRKAASWLLDADAVSRMLLPAPLGERLKQLLHWSKEAESNRKSTLRQISERIQASKPPNDDSSFEYYAYEYGVLTWLAEDLADMNHKFSDDGRLNEYLRIQAMLIAAKELLDNHIIIERLSITDSGVNASVRSYSVIEYIERTLDAHYNIVSDTLNAAAYGVPQQRIRYFAMGIRKAATVMPELPPRMVTPDNYSTVFDAIRDLQSIAPVFEVGAPCIQLDSYGNGLSVFARSLRDSTELHNHVTTNTTEKALARFRHIKQGQNFHDLGREMVEDTYSNPDRTQNSIYLRLKYDAPSATVLNVRKSMWIHPELHRAISIREAARLQSFPDSYVFEGLKDAQYQQIGNAVAPLMAKAVAEKCIELLDRMFDEKADG